MLLNIPFYLNNEEWNQCCQVAMKSAIKYFLNKEYSLSELDKITWRSKWKWTWSSQVAYWLFQLWLNVKYYSKYDLNDLLNRNFLKEIYWYEFYKILKYTDFSVLKDSIKKCLKYNLFEKKIISLDNIEKFIYSWCIVLVVINYNQTIWKSFPFQWHMVVITWFDDENIFYHKSWPKDMESNRKISKEVFKKAMEDVGTLGDVVVVEK